MWSALPAYSGVLAILMASLFRRDAVRRREDAITAVVFVGYMAVGTLLAVRLIELLPRTIDPTLLHIDRALGLNTFRIAGVLAAQKWLMPLLRFSYAALPVMIGVAWIAEQNPLTRLSAAIAGLVCFVFYASFPAVGPLHYDWNAQIATGSMRNCMPSMHLTWAILIAWNGRARPFRTGLWVYAGLIALATIALGEHYVVDLLAAIPFSIAVQKISQQVNVRLRQRPATLPAFAASATKASSSLPPAA